MQKGLLFFPASFQRVRWQHVRRTPSGFRTPKNPDTLTKQRFLDRYDNVFMTKVPTRHMFKIELSQYYQARTFALSEDRAFNNTSLQLGYEFKFLPAFSIALAGHLPYYGDLKTPFRESFQNTVLDAQLRWFMAIEESGYEPGKPPIISSGKLLSQFFTICPVPATTIPG